MKNLHSEFETIINNHGTWRELMKYNCAGDDLTYENWEKKRKFIAHAINDNGTILDIGCAGGFFLRSLQEWSGYDLIPYGIDIDEKYIEEAKKVFPEYTNHFLVLDAKKDFKRIFTYDVPRKYDFVYVSIFDLTIQANIDFIQKEILPLAKKRLIIGFYAQNRFPFDTPEWKKEREIIEKGINNLKKSNLNISSCEFNPTQFNQAVAWIDVN